MKKTMYLIFGMLMLMALFAFPAHAGEIVRVTMINQDPDPVEPGSYVDVRWKIENVGKDTAENAVFTIIPSYPFSLDPGVSDTKQLGNIESYSGVENSVIVKYRLKVDSNAVDGDNEINAKYFTKNAGWVDFVDPFYISVKLTDVIMSVNDITTNPSRLNSGEPGTLSLTLRNEANKKLQNIHFNLDFVTYSAPVSIIGSSNEISFNEIKPSDSQSVLLNLLVNPSATSGIYNVPFTLTYKDIYGTSYTKTGIISLVVDNTPEYKINLDDSEVKLAGDKGNVIISISNTGSSQIRLLTMTIEKSGDYDIIGKDQIYIGNMDSDDLNTAEFMIYVKNFKKTVPIALNLEYKDAFNKNYNEMVTVNLPMFTREEATTLGLITKQTPQGLIIGIIIFALMFIFWLFMLIDCARNHLVPYKKLLWVLLIISTFVVGALIYFFMARKKEK